MNNSQVLVEFQELKSNDFGLSLNLCSSWIEHRLGIKSGWPKKLVGAPSSISLINTMRLISR